MFFFFILNSKKKKLLFPNNVTSDVVFFVFNLDTEGPGEDSDARFEFSDVER